MTDDRGRPGPVGDVERGRPSLDAVGPDDAYLIIYTSGTTGRPKGVVLTHERVRRGPPVGTEMELFGPGDVVYLYLPLAHVFAQLVQADCSRSVPTIAFFGGDTTEIIGELGRRQADRAAVGPAHLREDLRGRHGMVPPGGEEATAQAIAVGVRGPRARAEARDVSAEDERVRAAPTSEMFALVRGIFGGNVQLRHLGRGPDRARDPPSSSTPPACRCSRAGG